MEDQMERTVFRKIATPADRHEYRRWALAVSVFYGVLFLGGISYAVVHHYQTPNHISAATTTP
jgi:hypothetical protein